MFTFFGYDIFAQNNQVQFLEKEKGFVTKDGCKILVKQYYGLSEVRYYFRVNGDKTYFFIDTTEVNCIEDIKTGKNKELSNAKHPGLKQKIWVGTVGVGIILVPIGGAITAYLVYENGPAHLGIGLPFVSFTGAYAYAWFKAFQEAIRNVKLVKAYRTAKPYLCQ
jgi:hypothetical protein